MRVTRVYADDNGRSDLIMKSGERYIIEIEEVVGKLAKIKGFNTLVFDENGLDKLERINGNYFSRDKVNEEKEFSYRNGKNVGYSEGYDEGFKAGVKHQESMIPPKAEPHVPQIGDIYRNKTDSAIKIIITYDPVLEGDDYAVLFPDGGYQVYDTEELNKYFEFVENRADALEPIKGALA